VQQSAAISEQNTFALGMYRQRELLWSAVPINHLLCRG